MEISIRNITKHFGKKQVITDLSFDAGDGKLVGILGQNGSGKSTLFAVLTGLLKGQGSFLCDGVDLMKRSSLRAKTVGFVPQSPPLIDELSVKDNLRLWYSREAMLASLQDGCLKMLGIDEFLNMPVSKLSGGMKKRLSIGCAIAHNPRVLLLDEPTSALDLLCKQRIYDYLHAFCEQGGLVVMATHDVHELAQCDDLYLLKNGRVQLYTASRDAESLVGQLRDE